MSLSNLPLRAGELAGKIKQADALVIESKVMVERAEAKLALERSALEKHTQMAADLREQRAALAVEAQELLARIGEPVGDSGEEVIESSADVGGDAVDALPPADVFNQGIEAVQPWAANALPEPIFGDGPAPEYAAR